MEEKERYEVMSPSLNGYAYIHDLKTDNVLNTYDSCDLLNQQSKRIKELEKENQQLHSQPAEIVEKIRSKCCVEDKCKDGSFVLGINEKDLDTILKEYQK